MSNLEGPQKLAWATAAYYYAKPIYERGETVTYSEVADAIGYPYAVWHRHFGDVLGVIALVDPRVAEVIVRKDSGRPSDRFYEWAKAASVTGLAKARP
jgi:hypothetical protein